MGATEGVTKIMAESRNDLERKDGRGSRWKPAGFSFLKRSLLGTLWLLIGSLGATTATGNWLPISAGLDIAKFGPEHPSSPRNAHILVVRIDPAYYDLGIYAKPDKEQPGLTAKEWCEQEQLIAAINAGMYREDYHTHVGYLKVDNQLNSRHFNKYKSLAVLEPYQKDLPPFAIYDMDGTQPFDIRSIIRRYRFVVQNLRLIKRPGINRWDRQNKRWSEAALGEDRQGRVLLIHSVTPYSMYDLNKTLLTLPINLVTAQHLEGGPPAQLFLSFNEVQINRMGRFEDTSPRQLNRLLDYKIPHVIGVRLKIDSDLIVPSAR